jgi:hypothetical protein
MPLSTERKTMAKKTVVSKSSNFGKIDNKDIKYKYKEIRDRTHQCFDPARKGWNDALSGKPLDYDYVSSNPMHITQTYENYRLHVIGLIAAGVKPPRWNDPVTHPKAVHDAIAVVQNMNIEYYRNGVPLDYAVGEKFWMPAESKWNGHRDSQPNVY